MSSKYVANSLVDTILVSLLLFLPFLLKGKPGTFFVLSIICVSFYFTCAYVEAPLCFSKCRFDNFGITVGRQIIKWDEIHSITPKIGYVRRRHFFEWADNAFGAKKYVDILCGKVLCINSDSADLSRNRKDEGICIPYNVKIQELLKKYVPNYDVIENQNIGSDEKNKTVFRGNLLFYIYHLTVNLIVCGIFLSFHLFLINLTIWYTLITVLPLHIFIWKYYYYKKPLDFSKIKIGKFGVKNEYTQIHWNQMYQINIFDRKTKICGMNIKLGKGIGVNTIIPNSYFEWEPNDDTIYIPYSEYTLGLLKSYNPNIKIYIQEQAEDD